MPDGWMEVDGSEGRAPVLPAPGNNDSMTPQHESTLTGPIMTGGQRDWV